MQICFQELISLLVSLASEEPPLSLQKSGRRLIEWNLCCSFRHEVTCARTEQKVSRQISLSLNHQQIVLNIKPSSVSLSIDENEVYSFDLLGRLLTAWIADQTFVRTLENRVIRKWWDPVSPEILENIEELGPEAKRQFLEKTLARVTEICTLAG